MKFSVVAVAVAGVFSLPIALASAQGVNDAQIASIVVTANQVDIDAGKLATSQSTSDEVKAFARLMVTDHTGCEQIGDRPRRQAQGHSAGQPNQSEPEG